MKHLFTHFTLYVALCVALVVSLASCKNNDDIRPKDPTGRGETMSRTLIIYMAGENSLSYNARTDSIEIAEGLKLVDDSSRVVMFIDDAKSSRICVGTRSKGVQTAHTFKRNICSTDSADMNEVLDYIFVNYPAHEYGIVFWSHGTGWVFNTPSAHAPRRSFGIDNGNRDPDLNAGPMMNIPTLANILAKHPHTDFIFFDACFMQCVEVAYELREVTDIVAGSPAEIPGDGAPYQIVLQYLCRPQADIAGALQAYADYYVNGAGYLMYHGVELSAIATSKLQPLAAATYKHVQQLYANQQRPETDNVQRYCPRDRTTYYTEFFDMQHLLYNTLPEDEYNTWLSAFNDAVIARELTPQWTTIMSYYSFLSLMDADHTGAVSMYVPNEYDKEHSWTEHYKRLQWAKAVGFDKTGW